MHAHILPLLILPFQNCRSCCWRSHLRDTKALKLHRFQALTQQCSINSCSLECFIYMHRHIHLTKNLAGCIEIKRKRCSSNRSTLRLSACMHEIHTHTHNECDDTRFLGTSVRQVRMTINVGYNNCQKQSQCLAIRLNKIRNNILLCCVCKERTQKTIR